MRRISLSGLMGLVALCALAVFALRSPTELLAGVVYSATVAALATALLLAAFRPGPHRAFWAGFAVFGWAHLLLGLMQWPAPQLLSASLVELAYGQVSGTQYSGGSFLFSGSLGDESRTLVLSSIEKEALSVRLNKGVMVSIIPLYFAQVAHCLFSAIVGLGGGVLASLVIDRGDRRGRADDLPTRAAPESA